MNSVFCLVLFLASCKPISGASLGPETDLLDLAAPEEPAKNLSETLILSQQHSKKTQDLAENLNEILDREGIDKKLVNETLLELLAEEETKSSSAEAEEKLVDEDSELAAAVGKAMEDEVVQSDRVLDGPKAELSEEDYQEMLNPSDGNKKPATEGPPAKGQDEKGAGAASKAGDPTIQVVVGTLTFFLVVGSAVACCYFIRKKRSGGESGGVGRRAMQSTKRIFSKK